MKQMALVTGSSGFIGRHFARHLEETGWTVCAVDIKERWSHDVRTFFQVHPFLRFDLVIHCAAVVGGRQVIDGSPMDQAVNLELDAALFRWARKAKPGRIVYFSSPAAYPMARQASNRGLRLRETDINLARPHLPDALYGWIKLTGERLAHLARAEGIPVTVVRPFSGYGGDQDPDYPFRAFIERARAREDPFHVWGNGYQVRDFIHVDDMVRLTMTAWFEEFDGPVNLGTGRGVSMVELGRMVCEAAGYKPRLALLKDEPQGVRYRVADTTLMCHHLGEPKVTLEEGIRRALA